MEFCLRKGKGCLSTPGEISDLSFLHTEVNTSLLLGTSVAMLSIKYGLSQSVNLSTTSVLSSFIYSLKNLYLNLCYGRSGPLLS